MTTPPAAAAATVDESMIRRLVDGFYEQVRRDPVLGPVFDAAIGDDWSVHLPKMYDFWSSVILKTGRFRGSPVAAHIAVARHAALTPAHFARWLALFGQAARDVCPPEAAALFIARAELIAQSLQLAVDADRGALSITGSDGVQITLAARPQGGAG